MTKTEYEIRLKVLEGSDFVRQLTIECNSIERAYEIARMILVAEKISYDQLMIFGVKEKNK